ncbi:MAG: dihydroorotate dehydrogenase-like protein [Allorhizobium sp.]
MDLSTSYMGLTLSSPLVASASPLTASLDNIRQLEDCGAGAVVLPSIFEEQIAHEQSVVDALVSSGIDSFGEALSYFPSQASDTFNIERHLGLIEKAVAAVDIPVIASLNGISAEGWTEHARAVEGAGAQAIELNIYFVPTDLSLSGQQVEQRYLDVLSAVKSSVNIPVAVKIGPYFSAPGHMVMRLDEAGADALVLFNRFYEPDIDLARLELSPNLELSNPYEMRLPLLWIGILAGRTRASLAATTGVQSGDDVVKYLLAGADVVMTTSALLRHGIGHMRLLAEQLSQWLEVRGLDTPNAIRGKMNYGNIANPQAFERANYIKVLQGYPKR